MRTRRYLALGAAVVLVGLAAFGVATWAFGDSDDEASPEEARAAAPVNGTTPGTATATQQAASDEEIAARWTPEALREALAADTEKPKGPSGSTTPGSSNPAPAGGETADPSPSPSTTAQPKTALAAVACTQPKKLKPLAGYPYERGCYAGKLNATPSKQIGRLLSFIGDTGYQTCTASVVVTGIDGQGTGNRSVIVTAGHCVGDAPDPDKPGSRWTANEDPLFIPQPKVRELHDKLENPNVSLASTKAWLKANAWFPRTGSGGGWIGYTPTRWQTHGDWVYDFAAVVMAPRGTRTIYGALGGLGVDMRGTSPKEALSLGYPSKKPFDGRGLFVCRGKVKVGDGRAAPAELGIGCDMTPGSSGGPWFDSSATAWSVISVNSYGPPEIMFGPNLNGNHWPTFLAARNYGTPG